MTGIGPTMEHLSTEGLAAFIDGSLDEGARAAAVAHLADCADCRRELVDIRRALPARRMAPRVAAAAALAAAASIVVLLVPISFNAPVPSADRLRSEGGEALAAYGPEGDIAGPRPDLAWASAGPGAVYRVAVTSSGGAAIWGTSTEDTLATLPDSVSLGRGTTYRWWVEALMPDGGTRATSVREFRTPP